MTKTRRIIINILATYGRTLYSVACGIFTSRWVLCSLGDLDYGLFGLIGGLTAFIGFFNGLLSGAVARFYACSIGRCEVSGDKLTALEDSRKWFNSAVIIHIVLSIGLVGVGYPIGTWMIDNFFTIPPDRILACHKVFLFTCVACFMGLLNVPFSAMFTARQYIVELTIYEFFVSTGNIVLGYYMVTHPGDWLADYAFVICLISTFPCFLKMYRAVVLFPECRFRLRYFCDFSRIKEIFAYAGWQMFGCFGGMFKAQGSAILVNKYFGPGLNASMNVSNMVSAQAGSLTAAMYGAFMPAITTAYGARDLEGMRSLADRASKFGMLLSLVLVCPLSLELSYVMQLWLKTPPVAVEGLCLCMMLMLVIDKSTLGHLAAVNARGVIALYQSTLGFFLLLTVPIAWMLIVCKCGVYAVGYAMIITMLLCVVGRIWFARSLVGMSARKWLMDDCLPNCFSAGVALGVAIVFRRFMEPSLLRLILSSIVFEIILGIASWFLVLDVEERNFTAEKIKKVISNLKSRR